MADVATEPGTIHLQIMSRPELLAPVRGLVNGLALREGLDDLAACHLTLAMDEALTNVIRHGYEGRPDGLIWITAEPLGNGAGVRVIIEDRARSVDPAALRGRDLEDVRPGGLGLHLLRTLVDRFDHAPREGGGMRVVLEKRSAGMPDATA
jgi:anti-sigma regulatory factor (Ser/Thr protein kinase)